MKALYIDLFCGAGGTSTGVNLARVNNKAIANVIACVNHDKNAIASHTANHPDAIHYTEDIRTLDLTDLIAHTQHKRAEYPGAKIVLWASLECTNFSKAKGGQPRDADSRTLAEHLFRYIEALSPDYIQIENVEEFMSWGDLDEHNKPISRDAGRCYREWVAKVNSYGYQYGYRILNAADFGAYTSRKRFFGIFAKDGLPIVFPEPTHAKEPQNNLLYQTAKWKPVKDVLDLCDEGISIFNRKKPLVDATLDRIYAGLVKFVAGGKDEWILKYNSTSQKGKKHNPPGIEEPCPTVACQNRLGVVKAVRFLSKYYGGDPYSKNISIEQPAGTLTTKDHHSFVSAYYGNGTNHSIEEPAPTLTTKDRLSIVSSEFLVNPQYSSAGGSIEKPCFTLIARMDKMPPYLVHTKSGEDPISQTDEDTPAMIRIKEFMRVYNIADIRMRMLKVDELKMIMGFPRDYTLIGTQAEQKKYIGNAVEVTMAKVLCEALCEVI